MSIISLRKAAQGPLGKIFLAILFFSMFAGFGLTKIFSKFFKGLSADGVALVNGRDISKQELQSASAQEEQRITAIRQKYGVHADLYLSLMGLTQEPRINALIELIHGALLDDIADDLSLNIAQEYIEQRIADPRFLSQEIGHLLPQEFITKQSVNVPGALNYLRQTGQMAFIEQEVKIKLKKQFATYMIHSAFFLPQFMVKEMYKEKMLAKKFSYQMFDLNTFIAQQKTKSLSDETIRVFYNEQNKVSKRYWSQETRDASICTFTADSFGIEITKEEAMEYYAKHKSTRFIKEPVQVKVSEIVFGDIEKRGLKALKEEAELVHAQLVANPSLYKEMVKKYSTHKESAAKDGIVDFFKRSTKDKEYERAAFKLKEDGQISPVFETKDGFVILQRIARKEPVFESFDSVKGTIEKNLLEQKFKSEFMRKAQQLIRSEDADSDGVNTFITVHKGIKENSKKIQKDANTMLSQRLFSLKNEGDKAAFIKDGKGFLIELTGRTKAAALSLEQIKPKVIEDYIDIQATKDLENAVQEAKKRALKNNKLIATTEDQKIQTTDFIPFDAAKIKEELIKKGFPQSFFELTWQGAVVTGFSEKNGVVIRLDEVEELKTELFESKKSELLKNGYQEESMLFLQAFIASLFRTATIEVDNEFSRVKDQL